MLTLHIVDEIKMKIEAHAVVTASDELLIDVVDLPLVSIYLTAINFRVELMS